MEQNNSHLGSPAGILIILASAGTVLELKAYILVSFNGFPNQLLSFIFDISPPVSLHHSLVFLTLRLSLPSSASSPDFFPDLHSVSLVPPGFFSAACLCPPPLILVPLPLRCSSAERTCSFLRLRDLVLVACGQSAKRSPAPLSRGLTSRAFLSPLPLQPRRLL